MKVVAINDYGVSEMSDAGSGDGLETIPDAPISLENDLSVTSDSIIRLTWQEGASNGDSPVLDYKISYDQSTGNFIQLADGVADLFYQTTVSLTKGQTYSFKV